MARAAHEEPEVTTLARLTTALADRYRVDRELGAGGMATVYLAHDLRHERDVAIKVLHPDLGAALGAERFLAEIKTTAKLQHPHILPLLDSGAADGLLFYVMPFIEGETLRARLVRETQLPIADAVRLAHEVADALQYAHVRGLVHRDIKPENILLHEGHALVADFGIALAVTNAGGQRMTQTGLSLGTPQYMAPEQAMGDKVVDARADLYALGAVTYEMLTGEPPFTGPSAQAIVARVLTSSPTPPSESRPTIPAHVEAALLSALAKLPADRQSSVSEFAAQLDGRAATTARVTRATGAEAKAQAPRPTRAVPVLVTLCVVLAGALGWQLVRGRAGGVTNTDAPTVFRLALADSQALFTVSPPGPRIALSRDGRRMVYVGPGPRAGETQLWMRRLDALEPVPIPGTEGGRTPALSPDGTQLAFTVRVSGNRGALRLMSVEGGNARMLTDSVRLRGVTWGRDGYLYAVGYLSSGFTFLGRVPEDGSRALEHIGSEATRDERHLGPVLLPNGRALLVATGLTESNMAIKLIDLKTGAGTTLLQGTSVAYAVTGHLLYTTNDGHLMAVAFDQEQLRITGAPVEIARGLSAGSSIAVAEDGTIVYTEGLSSQTMRELVIADRLGRLTPLDSIWRGSLAGEVHVSPDGARIAASRLDANGLATLWVSGLSGATPRTFGVPGDWMGTWSPDGRLFVVCSMTESVLRVFDAKTDMLQQTIRTPGRAFSPQFTPDGRRILFDLGGRGQLYIVDADGRSAPERLPPLDRSAGGPAISPDGRWFAFGSDGAIRVRALANPAGAEWTIAGADRPFTVSPRFSRDGRTLYYFTDVGNLMEAPLTPGPTFSAGRATVLLTAAQLGSTAGIQTNFEVLPDGRFLLNRPASQQDREHEGIVIMQYAGALLQRASGAR
jgi:serine/threonine-protein kinase